MPYKSKAQRRFFHAAEDRGEIPEGTAKRWEKHTPKGKSLPERAAKKAEMIKYTKYAAMKAELKELASKRRAKKKPSSEMDSRDKTHEDYFEDSESSSRSQFPYAPSDTSRGT
jgi:hypothetical protein